MWYIWCFNKPPSLLLLICGVCWVVLRRLSSVRMVFVWMPLIPLWLSHRWQLTGSNPRRQSQCLPKFHCTSKLTNTRAYAHANAHTQHTANSAHTHTHAHTHTRTVLHINGPDTLPLTCTRTNTRTHAHTYMHSFSHMHSFSFSSQSLGLASRRTSRVRLCFCWATTPAWLQALPCQLMVDIPPFNNPIHTNKPENGINIFILLFGWCALHFSLSDHEKVEWWIHSDMERKYCFLSIDVCCVEQPFQNGFRHFS